MSAGIYILYYERDDGQYYIGQSTGIEGRIKEHYNELMNNSHHNKKLQELYNLYQEYPAMEVLECVAADRELLNQREIYWIATFDSFYNGMNETMGGQAFGYGEDHPCAKYSNSKYIEVLTLLASNKSIKEVSVEAGVSKDVVEGLSKGHTHRWLASEYPELYSKMENRAKPNVCGHGENHQSSKYPNTIYIEILNLLANTNSSIRDIAIKVGVDRGIVAMISAGRTHRWLASEYPELYAKMRNREVSSGGCTGASALGISYPKIMSPEGEEYYVTNIRAFAREHNLREQTLGRVLRRQAHSTNGWRLVQ